MNEKNNNSQNKVQNLVLISQETLNELLENQKTMISALADKDLSTGLGDWVPEKDVQKILGRKTTTLYHLRKSGKITATKMGSKVFYSKLSIIQFLEANMKGGRI